MVTFDEWRRELQQVIELQNTLIDKLVNDVEELNRLIADNRDCLEQLKTAVYRDEN